MTQPPQKPGDRPPPNFPPEPPRGPVLPYRNPLQQEPGPRKNTVGKFMLRMLGGIFIGGFSIAMGVLLINVFQADGVGVPLLLFLPFVIVLTVMVVLTIQHRRFGYITGILLAPVIIVMALFVLLLIMCSGWRP